MWVSRGLWRSRSRQRVRKPTTHARDNAAGGVGGKQLRCLSICLGGAVNRRSAVDLVRDRIENQVRADEVEFAEADGGLFVLKSGRRLADAGGGGAEACEQQGR